MEEKEFLNVYQNIKFKENSSDCYSSAEIKRKTLAINFYGSIYLKENNYATECLLNENLREYSDLTDNRGPNGLNNYADCVLALLSNYQNDDKKNWKSHLDKFNYKDCLELLPCDNKINCKNSEFSQEDLKELKAAFIQYDNRNEISKISTFRKVPQNQILKKNNLAESQFDDVKVFSGKPVQNQKDEEPTKLKEGFFRTARNELEIQIAKKFSQGGNSNSYEKSLNYGTVKKSLGTRKGKVFGKFQPPIKSKETNEDHILDKMVVDEVVDERLKNIDPAMIELIKNEIMDCSSKITWDDIAGLHLAKSTIQEIVVWPMLRPDIFTGLRRPPKGILLFGPPGTGKTLIGKCIASQSNSTFFSISASSLTSKWVGDGEKMVRTLFAVAKVYQPSVVFIDEIDSLLSQRSDSEHECSRRIKTEFLVQLDGAGTGDEDRILIIGATNRPQELDEAARRRLVKRLYIPLPDEEARRQIIENLISTECHTLSNSEIGEIAKLTKGYSGADVKNLCQEASLGPIRSIAPSMIQSINPTDVRPLNAKDFESALCRIKSSVSESDLDIYVAWDKQYGCGSASNF